MSRPKRTPRPSSRHTLINSYFASEYRALWNGSWWSLRFATSARRRSCRIAPWPQPWVIITGCNPASIMQAACINQECTQRLHADLTAAGVQPIPAWGGATDGSWEEESLLACGLSRDQTLCLARRYGQTATVFGERGRVGLLLTNSARWIIRGANIRPVTA